MDKKPLPLILILSLVGIAGIILTVFGIRDLHTYLANPAEGAGGGSASALSESTLLIVGIIFFLCAAVSLITTLCQRKGSVKQEKIKSRILSSAIGLSFSAVGAILYCAFCNFNLANPFSAFKNAGLLVLFPLFFFCLGIYILFSTLLLSNRSRMVTLRAHKIKYLYNSNTYKILFVNDKIPDNPLAASFAARYYFYETKNKLAFHEDGYYQVDLNKYSVNLEMEPIEDSVFYAAVLAAYHDDDFAEITGTMTPSGVTPVKQR